MGRTIDGVTGAPIAMDRDMQLERSLITGVRFITTNVLAKTELPGRTAAPLPTFAQTNLLFVLFIDRSGTDVYDMGPVRPFASFPSATKRELFRPVRWDGLDLRLSQMVQIVNPGGKIFTIVWEFEFIDPIDMQ